MTTSSNDPEQIRREIERTRADLSEDVNALTHEVRPSTMVRRRTAGLRGAAGRAKEAVMGTAHDAAGGAKSSAHGVASTASDAAGGVQHAVAQAPQAVRSQTRGNPLAAGLVAFGLGAVIGSLVPSTEKERRLADQAKDAAQPLAAKAKEAGQQVVEDLKEPAQDAVQSVKETARDAASEVKDEAKGQAQEVRSSDSSTTTTSGPSTTTTGASTGTNQY
jgi:hypothetical protein